MTNRNSGYFCSATNRSVDLEIYMYCTSCKVGNSKLWLSEAKPLMSLHHMRGEKTLYS